MKDKDIYAQNELDFFEYIEGGKYTPLKKESLESEKKVAKDIAKRTIDKMKKKKSINLRVYERDIRNIKALALEKGIPYQTLLSSIIHQVASRDIKI